MKLDRRVLLIVAVPLLLVVLSYVVFAWLAPSMAAHVKQALALAEAVTGAIAASLGLAGSIEELERDRAELAGTRPRSDTTQDKGKPVDDTGPAVRVETITEPRDAVHTILEPRYAIRALLILVGGGLFVGGASAMPDCLTCV